MTDTNDFDTLLLGRQGAPSVSFNKIGDFVEGTVVEKDSQPKKKYNMDPDAPVVYEVYEKGPNVGQPIQELVLTLQTALRDPNIEHDDGRRRVFLKYGAQLELARVVKAAGSRGLPLGSKVRITFDRETPTRGFPRKEFKVEYWPPADPADTALMATESAAPAAGQDPELLAAIAALEAKGIKIPNQ